MKDYLRPSEVAKILNRHKVTIIRWIRKGKFEDVQRINKEFRIPIASFKKFQESTKFIPKKDG